MARCHAGYDDLFCKAEWLKKWNGQNAPSGWFWVIRGENMDKNLFFMDDESWVAPIPSKNYTDVVNLQAAFGIRWYVPASGMEPSQSALFE